jgi:hypothetical protein
MVASSSSLKVPFGSYQTNEKPMPNLRRVLSSYVPFHERQRVGGVGQLKYEFCYACVERNQCPANLNPDISHHQLFFAARTQLCADILCLYPFWGRLQKAAA